MQVLGVGHGRLPIDPAFGALRLPAADVHDHDGYFVPDTSALRAMALIAAGHVHEASRHPGRLGPVAAAQPAAAVRPGR